VGAPGPGSYTEFAKLSTVKEASGRTEAKKMIRNLVADQQAVVDSARRVIEAADAADDQASADLGTRRMEIHQKNAWMLRSHLE
jgi:starvation-inducible DNA-binding protein